MEKADRNFRARVYAVVGQIPKGRVMTYGQIAALCGSPLAARIVGGIAHQAPCANLPACGTGPQPADLTTCRADFASVGSLHRSASTARSATQQESARSVARMTPGQFCPSCDIPWQRVVKKDGSLAEGFPGGVKGHKQALETDGVRSHGLKVNVKELLWRP